METLFLRVLSMLAMESAGSIRSLYRHFLSGITEKSLNAVYYACSYVRIDCSGFMNVIASMALKLLPDTLRSNPVFLCVDDAMVPKSGKKFECVSKLFEHAVHNGSNYLNGHCFVSLMLCVPVWNQKKVSYLSVPLGYRMWQEKVPQNLKREEWMKYIPLFLYSLHWNIEVSYYEQKTFWLLCSYMVRSRKGIETLVNLINTAYCAMKILPYRDENFSEFKNESIQEFWFVLSGKIREQIFYVRFVQNVETHIKSDAVKKPENSCFSNGVDIYKVVNWYIQLEKDKKSENPQIIFESLNSTGLSLTQGDLIRNFLLMNHSYDEQTRLYKDYWLKIEKLLTNAEISDFVRDYLTMKNGNIPNKDKVYIAFKEYAKQPNFNMNEEGLLEDLLMYAEYYWWFRFCNSPYDTLNDSLLQLQQLKSTTVYPALLYVFEDCFKYKKIDIVELQKMLDLIISYLYRRLICSYPTHALNKIFAGFVNAVEKMSGENDYDKVIEFLMNKTSSGVFPRDEEFRNGFIHKDLYKTKVDKYTLFQLEKFESKEVVYLSDNITVEHIMPQKLSPTWQIELGSKYEEIHAELLHTVGNLTLTGYNPNLSNKSFSDKKEILKDSNISISRNLNQYDIWSKENILNRAEILFEIAKKFGLFQKAIII